MLIDETGVLLGPLLRRTLAVRGQTPQLCQRGRHRDRVSVAGALWLSPRRRRLGLFFRTVAGGHFNNVRIAAFVEALLRRLRGPLVIVWDGAPNHKGEPIRALLRRHPGRLWLERLPPYAPELNPLEQGWGWVKDKKLCNYAPADAQQLQRAVAGTLGSVCRHQQRLQGWFHASDLPLPRKLLS